MTLRKTLAWMVSLSGAALVWSTAATSVAHAQNLEPIINTNCSYAQAVAALDANDPVAAAQFHGSPPAQVFMQQYLAAPRDQRIQMAAQMQQVPGAAQFVGVVAMMAQECAKY